MVSDFFLKDRSTLIEIIAYICMLNNETKRLMSTVIYPSPIFGPIHSRRLGISLGINLLPGDGKFCTFD